MTYYMMCIFIVYVYTRLIDSRENSSIFHFVGGFWYSKLELVDTENT